MIANENQARSLQDRFSQSGQKSNQPRHSGEFSNQSVESHTPGEDSKINQFYDNRLQQIIRKIKVNQNVVTFINKLKRNAGLITPIPVRPSKSYQIETSKFLQVSYHFIIVMYYGSIMALLLLTSWTATITAFNQQVAASRAAIAVQVICLCVFILQQLCNFGSHFLRSEKYLHLTRENLRQELLSYNSINNIIRIVCSIFFLVFPTSMVVAALFFIVLVSSLFIGITELSHLEAAYIHTERRSILWKMFKILGLNILIIHVMATILVGMTHLSDNNNWFIKFDLVDETWFNQYITSFYWSTIIVTTIGFGDISASTPNEKLIVSFLSLIACILLAFNITSFSKFFSSLTENYEKVQLQVVKFRRMIRRDYKNNVDIDPLLKIRIYNHLYSLSADKRELEFLQKNQFLSCLPERLRKDYHKNTNRNLFSSLIFFNLLRNETLSALSEKFSMHFLEENDTLYSDDQQIRVLQIGQISLTYQRAGSSINGKVFDRITIGKRENVGLLTTDFLTLQRLSNYGLCATTYSVIWNMSTENFINVLRNDVMDFQYYFTILHKHTFDEDIWGITDCSRCFQARNPIRHCAYRCPKLTYMPYRKIIAGKIFYTPEILLARSPYCRNKRRAPKTPVLKHWKNYFKSNYELERRRDEDDHRKNILPKPKIYFSQKQREVLGKSGNKVHNHYYIEKQRDEAINESHSINFELDSPFNFEFYAPKFNPCRLIFTRIDKCQNLGQISVTSDLKNVMHIKGQVFSENQLKE